MPSEDPLDRTRPSGGVSYQPTSSAGRTKQQQSSRTNQGGSIPFSSGSSKADRLLGPNIRLAIPPNSTNVRPQSNIGARLLKKRQSVSYHAAIQGGIGPPMGLIPAVPSLPPSMQSTTAPLNIPQSSLVLGAPMNQKRPLQSSRSPSLTPSTESGIDRILAGTGVDIEMLAAEGFKPEDCETVQLLTDLYSRSDTCMHISFKAASWLKGFVWSQDG